MRRAQSYVFEVPAPASLVWATFWDVPTIASCIPGCETAEERETGTRYFVRIRRSVGPFLVRLEADVAVIERIEPEWISIKAQGADKRLRSTIQLDLRIRIEEGAPLTRVSVESQLELSGLLVSVGERLITMQIDREMQAFVEALRAILTDRGVALEGNGGAIAPGPAGRLNR